MCIEFDNYSSKSAAKAFVPRNFLNIAWAKYIKFSEQKYQKSEQKPTKQIKSSCLNVTISNERSKFPSDNFV